MCTNHLNLKEVHVQSPIRIGSITKEFSKMVFIGRSASLLRQQKKPKKRNINKIRKEWLEIFHNTIDFFVLIVIVNSVLMSVEL